MEQGECAKALFPGPRTLVTSVGVSLAPLILWSLLLQDAEILDAFFQQ